MSVSKRRRILDVKVLPGEPTDGTGRVCIHLFVQNEAGAILEPHVLHPVFRDGEQVKQELVARPTRGGIACDLRRPIHTDKRGVVTVVQRTDDPRAVTCPKCKASEAYKSMVAKLK